MPTLSRSCELREPERPWAAMGAQPSYQIYKVNDGDGMCWMETAPSLGAAIRLAKEFMANHKSEYVICHEQTGAKVWVTPDNSPPADST
jgi:hypothetical protein